MDYFTISPPPVIDYSDVNNTTVTSLSSPSSDTTSEEPIPQPPMYDLACRLLDIKKRALLNGTYDNDDYVEGHLHVETAVFHALSQEKFEKSNKWTTQIDKVLKWVKQNPGELLPREFAESYYAWVDWFVNVELPVRASPRANVITWPLKRKQLNKLDKEVPTNVMARFSLCQQFSVDSFGRHAQNFQMKNGMMLCNK